MQFSHFVVHVERGDLLQVRFGGTWANIRLLNELEFQSLCAGREFAPTCYETSPVYLRPPFAGDWFIVVDFDGRVGSARDTIVVPWQLIRIGVQIRGRVAPMVPPSDLSLRSLSYYTGELIQRADEIEIWYPEVHGIPHRGIIHSVQTGPMVTTVSAIHNSKRCGGVCIVSFADFEQGKLVNLRRRADSPEHADAIIARAESAIQHQYNWRMASCEQFTDWRLYGRAGRKRNLEGGRMGSCGDSRSSAPLEVRQAVKGECEIAARKSWHCIHPAVPRIPDYVRLLRLEP